MKNKKLVIISTVVVALIVAIIGVVLWYVNIKKPHDIAVQEYQAVVTSIEEKNLELDNAIIKLQELIDSGEKPLDDSLIDSSKDTIKTIGASKILVSEMPKKTEEIIATTTSLTIPDYTEELEQLEDSYTALDTSINQYKQFINPTEEFVIQRLQTIDEVQDVRAVTEDHDPNGQLNKPGGYTATVYFESSNVNQANVYGGDLIEKGTEAGGGIEVYANEDDANKRNEYLAIYDGGVLSPGSHRVVGTVVIRTSNLLTASQQKELEEKMITAMAAL